MQVYKNKWYFVFIFHLLLISMCSCKLFVSQPSYRCYLSKNNSIQLFCHDSIAILSIKGDIGGPQTYLYKKTNNNELIKNYSIITKDKLTYRYYMNYEISDTLRIKFSDICNGDIFPVSKISIDEKWFTPRSLGQFAIPKSKLPGSDKKVGLTFLYLGIYVDSLDLGGVSEVKVYCYNNNSRPDSSYYYFTLSNDIITFADNWSVKVAKSDCNICKKVKLLN